MINGPTSTVKLARKLLSEMSLPERMLWSELRKRPGDFKFRRQHPAGHFILDFYCAALKLAIEIDGAAHDSAEAVGRDEARSHFLRSQGIATTRIPARKILSDKESVVLRIVEICRERQRQLSGGDVPLHHPADGTPPRAGEELQ